MRKRISILLVPSSGKTRRLRLDTRTRPLGVLFFTRTEELFDLEQLRADPGAKIVTDNPQAVCWALGLHHPDKQVAER